MSNPRKLAPGDIVRNRDARGVVQWSCGRGDWPLPSPGPVQEGDAIIYLAPGHTRVTNQHSKWEQVPPGETTAIERVRSVRFGWTTEMADDDDDPSEPGTYGYALVRALFPPDSLLEVFPDEGDWPASVDELVGTLACVLDERAAWHQLEREGAVFS